MSEPREPINPEGAENIDYQKLLVDSFNKLFANKDFIIVVMVYKHYLNQEDDEQNLRPETEDLIKKYLFATILGELYKIIYGIEHDEEDDEVEDEELRKYINLIKIDLNSKTGILSASFMSSTEEDGIKEFKHSLNIFTA